MRITLSNHCGECFVNCRIPVVVISAILQIFWFQACGKFSHPLEVAYGHVTCLDQWDRAEMTSSHLNGSCKNTACNSHVPLSAVATFHSVETAKFPADPIWRWARNKPVVEATEIWGCLLLQYNLHGIVLFTQGLSQSRLIMVKVQFKQNLHPWFLFKTKTWTLDRRR